MVAKEIKTYESGGIEEKRLRKGSCAKSGSKYTDGHGRVGGKPYFCGVPTCPICLQHRINNEIIKFDWMQSKGEFVFKVVSKVDLTSPDKVDDAFFLLHNFKENILQEHSDLWFRAAMTSKNIIVVLKKEDANLIKFPEITFTNFIRDYVDFTEIKDEAIEERLLIGHKNKRRILGHGKTPEQAPKACCLGIIDTKDKKIKHALKHKAEIITVEEVKVLPEAKQYPVEELTYAVDDPECETESIDLSFADFVKEVIQGHYTEEWEAYHRGFKSKRMQTYLKWLYNKSKNGNNKKWEFLKDLFGTPNS